MVRDVEDAGADAGEAADDHEGGDGAESRQGCVDCEVRNRQLMTRIVQAYMKSFKVVPTSV